MEPHFQTRRRWLLGTGAALSALVCAPLLRPARAAGAAGPGATPAAGPARPAQGAGTFAIGGDLTVNRLGFGAMRVTGPGIWGQPPDPVQARAVLRRVVELGWCHVGQRVGITAGLPSGRPGTTSLFQIQVL